MERRVHSVPETLREAHVLTDGFATRLRQRGWTLFEHSPIHTDPRVICQKWCLSPEGRAYSDREFYHLFGEWRFRTFLRVLLGSAHVTVDQLVDICPDQALRTSYLTFLHDQEMLLYTKEGYERGPALEGVQDLGHTLEWWCAEWIRRAFAKPFGQVPVRHGVTLAELVRDGDFDVVAFLGETLLFVECKSSSLSIDPATLNLFTWRTVQLKPDLAVLLIDATALHSQKSLAKVKTRIKRLEIEAVDSDEARGGVYCNGGQPHAATRFCKTPIYIALSTSQNSLEHVLSATLQHYSGNPVSCGMN